ncbi:hypothetical protein [Neisseria dentiae]|uniref:hypothetical protein n=1 Tax=Neisseria dentiae TaxID=194197 RepID=UPI00211C465E|nr:hypothetical protein [Neisseria dentiae]MCQ9326297.1 hypothetical protein [Neisseria dentiae]
MIKYHEKKSNLYNFSMIASVVIEINIDILLKIFNIDSRNKLNIVIFLSFLIFYVEMICVLFIFQWSVIISYEGLLYMLGLSVFIFFLCRSYLPYWEDEL